MSALVRAVGVSMLTLAMLSACSDDETGDGDPSTASSGTGGTSSNGGSGSGGDETPDASCVKQGEAGNAKGIGTYCTPGGGECAAFPEAGLCLADVGQDQWFCTQIMCTETTDCGEDAGCEITEQGSACVPCKCDDQTAQCQGGVGGAGGTGGAGGAG